MPPSRLITCALLSAILSSSLQAGDAVSVDAAGNTVFTGTVSAVGQIGAPNVLQGVAGVSVTAAATLTSTAFGAWHWISGTAADYTITLPTAVGHAGKTIGLRVRDATAATKTYTLAAVPGQTIDGATTIALSAHATLVVMSDGTGWARISGTPTSATPSGFIAASAGVAVPAGWLECNGQAVSRTAYPALFAAIGTTWGAGDGTTTFNVPNLGRRTLVGAGGSSSAVLGNAVGNVGGAETHTLTIAEMPAHDHPVTLTTGQYTSGAENYVLEPSSQPGFWSLTRPSSYGSQNVTGKTAQMQGGNAPHNNMQPSAVVRYLIKM